jgi:DNA replication and repair protein RecF
VIFFGHNLAFNGLQSSEFLCLYKRMPGAKAGLFTSSVDLLRWQHMKVRQLQVQDFRNYAHQTWDFTEDQVVFCGPNGRGKTNVLEAISLLSVGKSWREQAALDLIADTAPPDSLSAVIKGQLENRDWLEVQVQPRSRRFFRNEKPTTRTRFFGQLPTLLFCPEYIALFSGAKLGRNQFFDRFLVQISPRYRETLLRATRAHKQKTKILRQSEVFGDHIAQQLQPWNQLLAETLPVLHAEKLKLISLLAQPLQAELEEISQQPDSITLGITLAEPVEYETKALLAWYEAHQGREIAAQKNFLAPGRDDWSFTLRERPLSATASRGEERSALLALLAAQKRVLKESFDQTPVLLLDDVFSELDNTRQRHLEHLCAGSQVFFSTTHPEHFEGFSGAVQVFAL